MIGVASKPNSGRFKKGNIPWHTGRKGVFSEETLRIMALRKIGKPGPWRGKTRPRRENNPLWKGGRNTFGFAVRSLPEYKIWRLGIFERDKFTCLNCGKSGGYLHAHHLVPFKTLLDKYNVTTIDEALKCSHLWNIQNGITICTECHRRYHYA